MTLAAPGGTFTVNARADRIDRGPEGLAIIDYKTGQVPTTPQVEKGWAPQLSLEAAIIERGGFEGLDGGPVAELVYLMLTGGRTPGEERAIDLDPVKAAADAVRDLTALVARFDDPNQPYLSQRGPQLERRPGDYDHLARVREWRGGVEDGE